MKNIKVILIVLTILMIAIVMIHKKSSQAAHGGEEQTATTQYLEDSRDGQKYKTVKIGDQIWMAENLNYETENSYCYRNSADSCAKYGRLYTWAAAMDSAGKFSKTGKGCGDNTTCSPTYPVQGICPKGWHLPSESDWETLLVTVGGPVAIARGPKRHESTAGIALKSTHDWFYAGEGGKHGNGTDGYGFTGLPAGERISTGLYNSVKTKAYFWSSTESTNKAFARNMRLNVNFAEAWMDPGHKSYGFSVRCLRD